MMKLFVAEIFRSSPGYDIKSTTSIALVVFFNVDQAWSQI